ncbi:MAG TPA: hypothetical protein VK629_13050 [Steroidobacteraceae bacterium]|nr:hypothetical protein [Steroidobacteraceae bacterium]
MRIVFCVVLSAIVWLDASAAPASASPLIGRWAVDISRLPIPPEARPRSVTITFTNAGNESLTMQVKIVDAAGAEINSVGTGTLDGKATSVAGSPEADLSAMKMPAPDVLVLALGKDRLPASTRIYAVSEDGKTMIETAVYFESDGLPVMRTNYFTRAR